MAQTEGKLSSDLKLSRFRLDLASSSVDVFKVCLVIGELFVIVRVLVSGAMGVLPPIVQTLQLSCKPKKHSHYNVRGTEFHHILADTSLALALEVLMLSLFCEPMNLSQKGSQRKGQRKAKTKKFSCHPNREMSSGDSRFEARAPR